MARVNVYLPDDLARTVRDKMPGLNWSATLRGRLEELLGCDHEHLECRECRAEVARRRIRGDALDRFYRDLVYDLGEHTRRGGTAQGAAVVARSTAMRHQVPAAREVPLPRLSRGEREHLSEQLPPEEGAA